MKWVLIAVSLVSLVLVNLLIASLMFPSKVQPIVVTSNENSSRCDLSSCEDSSLLLIDHEATAAPNEASSSALSYDFMLSFQGCSHGFWMQEKYFDLWGELRPTQNLESAFDIPDSYELDHISLHDALSFRGGSSPMSAARGLLKEATTALLNASSSELEYPIPVAQVLEETNAALASDNPELMVLLATQLQNYNNNGCPIR